MLEEMLEKAHKDNKILMQLLNHHNEMAETAKNKMSRDVQILNLFITMFSYILIKLYTFVIMFDS
jgi:hypothetical protein